MHLAIQLLIQWLRQKQILIVSLVSSTFISVWTILRHITNGINFDVVGQIGVAEQWMNGIVGGAQLGSTNYLFKIPLYMLVNLFHFIEPKTRLLLLALAFNIATILTIYWLGRKILRLYDIKNYALLNFGVLWLSLISGRVFWTDYANSRNLEIAAGVAVIYLMLKLWKKWSNKTALVLLAVASCVFFSDPLQLYVIGAGGAIYGIVSALISRRAAPLKSSVVLVLAGIVSKVLLLLTTYLLPVHFLNAPKITITYSLDTFLTIVKNLVNATLRVFDINILTKALSVNSLRQVGGIVLLGFIVYIIIRYRKQVRFDSIDFFAFLIGWNYLVYIVSGNAIKPLTERYILLVPILVMLIVAFYGPIATKQLVKRGILLSHTVLLFSGLLLMGAVLMNWQNRFALDKPVFETARFARQSTYDFIVTSRGLAIPGNYYAGYAHTLVPLICVNNTRVVASNLFYDQGSYQFEIGMKKGITAVLLPNEGIVSDPFSCSRAVVLAQFGTPLRQFELNGVGTVYEYQSSNKALRPL